MQTPLFALLVGINSYQAPFIPPLRGCRNDVDLLASVLRSRFSVPDDHIVMLCDEEATRASIELAFRKHLIEHARSAQLAGGPAPACLFHFSGHGSRVIDQRGTKLAGVDETIVPCDSRQSGVLDIPDWQLGAWLDELAEFTNNITVLLDCCHSGSGTRDLDVASRMCAADYRELPARTPTLPTATHNAHVERQYALRHVLLSACSNSETAKEWKDITPDREQHYGAFTFAVAEELSQLSDLELDTVTYRDLHRRLTRRLGNRHVAQSPQCEGERDRLLFGGMTSTRSSWICVTGQVNDLLAIDAGGVHGLAIGNELLVYPKSISRLQANDHGDPLARIKIIERQATTSLCQIIHGSAPIDAGCPAVPLQFASQLIRTLSLHRTNPQTKAALGARLMSPPWKEILRETDEAIADLIVVSTSAGDLLLNGAGQLVESTSPVHDIETLSRGILKWARYLNVLQIVNPSPQSSLRGLVRIELQLANGRTISESGQLLPADNKPQDITILLKNQSTEPLYFYALVLGYDGSVSQVWPPDGEQIPVPPGKSKTLDGLQLCFPREANRHSVSEAIKLFATRTPTDFDLLTMDSSGEHLKSHSRSTTLDAPMPPRSSSLDALFSTTARHSNTRLIQPKSTPTEEDWATAELIYQLVHSSHDSSQLVTGGQPIPITDLGCIVTAPSGFQGTIRPLGPAITHTIDLATSPCTHDAENTRSSNQPPLSMAPPADPFHVWLSSLGDDVALIEQLEIEADDASRSRVTSNSPMTIEWTPAQRDLKQVTREGVIAIASDGELLFPVGVSPPDTDSIEINWLPPVGAQCSMETGTRSIAGATKLYIFKLFNWESGSLGLHRALWFPLDRTATIPIEPGERIRRTGTGEVRLKRIAPGELRTSNRTLVLVHGELGDAPSMLSELGPVLQQSGVHYDHIVTFTYETIASSLQNSAASLAQALRSAGLTTENTQVDVIASGMGSLVVRAAIELLGAHTCVTRCLLAGAPNTGTLLAKSQKIACWLGTLALAKAMLTPQLLPALLAVNKAINEAAAIRDLQPLSEFLTSLNASMPSVAVHYTLLAGVADLSPELSGFARRLLDKSLSILFDDEHDMVCSQISMQTVRNGQHPPDRLSLTVVSADHFSYWTEATSVNRVMQWLKEAYTPRGPK